MKKIITIIIVIATIASLSSCGGNRQVSTVNFSPDEEIAGYCVADELPSVMLGNDEYNSFCTYIDYDNINCPHSELFGIDEAMAEKNSRIFDTNKHSFDFFGGARMVDSGRLYEFVHANNKEYMNSSVDRHFTEELSDSELRKSCEMVAKAINWGIENTSGIDFDELGCVLGNLKILKRNSMNYGSFNYKNGVLSLTPEMMKNKKTKNGDIDIFENIVTHEAMHILQSRCLDIEANENDTFIGTSYFFENLEVNPLKNSWLYEGSAEINTSLFLKCEPETYQYMINNIESVSLATVLNDNIQARQFEKLCFTQNDEALLNQLEFSDKRKAVEFLYATELLRCKPDDFKIAYENKYGSVSGEYSEFLKKTFNPYFTEVLSKLLYKNLALKLTMHEISLGDVFYIISVYELDLLKDIPLNSSSVKEEYGSIYQQYADLQKNFFDLLQNHTDVNVESSFNEYQANYKNGSLYANASLEWLSAEKRDYILSRNNVMYDKYYKHIIAY